MNRVLFANDHYIITPKAILGVLVCLLMMPLMKAKKEDSTKP